MLVAVVIFGGSSYFLGFHNAGDISDILVCSGSSCYRDWL